MEKEIRIKTPDKKIVDGILYGPINKPLIVIVHGLSGNMNEAMHYNAARYFFKQGFSSFRFNLYSWHKDNRKMHECTLKTHGQDIDTVLEYLRGKGTKKIFMVGHSYGFPSILHAKDHNFFAVASWDGTQLPHEHFVHLRKISKPKARLMDEGAFVLLGEAMVQESQTTKTDPMVKRLHRPLLFVTNDSKDGGNLKYVRQTFKSANEPKYLHVVKGASHNFTEDGKQEQLYRETVKWFKKFLK